jgi:3-deoxy-7-phosphoheptulonate synthase
MPWSPSSWRKHKVKQQPVYRDEAALAEVLRLIHASPPLVAPPEIEVLRRQLAEAARGERFVLQGGDCAERFVDCTPEAITAKLKILLQMSLVLTVGTQRPTIRIGRIAGQYAKPRSSDFEERDGRRLPVFRGDNVNSFEDDPVSREPDPERLLRGLHHASMTLNYLRTLLATGFANIHHPENWDLSLFPRSPQRDRYEEVVRDLPSVLALLEGRPASEPRPSDDFFTSHEGLILSLEEAMTRFVPESQAYYNLGAHMLWIGDRTRDLDGAHVEYFRGIRNPIGLKWGPSADPDEMVDVIRTLIAGDPLPGRVTVISRFGADRVEALLPKAIQAVKRAGLPVLWTADPMHGNTVLSREGVKTRDFGAILTEVRRSFAIHRSEGTCLGGVHFELTGDHVTECIGGAVGVQESDLKLQYETFCDPRLNYSQSLEMAFVTSEILAAARR